MSRIRRIIGMPDYDVSKVIDVKSKLDSEGKWTAPANGCVISYVLSGDDNTTEVYINDIYVARARYSTRWSDDDNPGPIPIAKGDVIKFSKPSVLTSAEFYPCK